MELFSKYQGKHLIPSKAAIKEMDFLNLDTFDLKEILDEGFDCERSKRKANIVEKCKIFKNKVIKVVLVDVEAYWLIVHVGQFSSTRFKGEKNEYFG